jgi:hypothetical protein
MAEISRLPSPHVADRDSRRAAMLDFALWVFIGLVGAHRLTELLGMDSLPWPQYIPTYYLMYFFVAAAVTTIVLTLEAALLHAQCKR